MNSNPKTQDSVPMVMESDGRRKFFCRTNEQVKAVPWEQLVPGDVVYVSTSTGENHEENQPSDLPERH